MKDILTELHSEYATSNGTVVPSFYEEYCTKDGFINFRYVCKKFDKGNFSTKLLAESRAVVAELFGTLTIKPCREYQNEVSFTDFKSHYEFAKYPNVLAWIQHLYDETGQVLTKEKCYEYVLKC
jgi:hypothetical protein